MEANRRISKIKLKNGNIFIGWQERTEEQPSWDDYTLRCDEQARPEFYKALEAFNKHIAIICELPNGYEKRITTSGISYSYNDKKGIWGVTLIGLMELKNTPAPLNLITPFKSAFNTEESQDYALPDACIGALKKLDEEAFRYVNGDRAQVNLFDQEDKSEVDITSAPEKSTEEIEYQENPA